MAASAQLAVRLSMEGENQVIKAMHGVAASMGKVAGATAAPVKALGGLGNALGDIAKIGAGVAVGGVFGALASGVGGVATSMITGNAEMERYETQLATLLGGADKAKERLAELARFGATTPFELPEVVRAEKVLLGFGLTGKKALELTGKSGTELRTIIGDIAAGTGASFEEIALNFGKFSAGATGEAISRFQELGIVTREQMAAMGIEFSKSGELISPLPKAMAAAVKIANSKFGGGMKALSETWEGQMSTLMDNWNAMLRTVGQPIFEALKPQLAALNELLGSEGFQKRLAEVAALLANGISQGVQIAGQAFSQLAVFLAPAMRMLPDLVMAFQQVVAFMQTGAGDIEKFRGVLNALLGPAGAQGVIEIFTNLVGFFRSNVVPLWEGLGAAAKQALGGDLMGALGAAATVLASYGAKLVESLSVWAKRFIEWVAPFVPPMLAALGQMLMQLGSWLVGTALPAIGAKVLEWGKAFIAWVAPFIPPMLAALGQMLQQLGSWLVGVALPIVAARLQEWGQAFVAWVAPQIPPLLAALGQMLVDINVWAYSVALPAILAQLAEWGKAFVGWVAKDVIPHLPGALDQIDKALTTWTIAAAKWALVKLTEVGDAVVAGIIQGITTAAPRLMTAAWNLATEAVEAGKRALLARSPSQVTNQEIGVPFVEGIIAGLNAAGPAFQAAVKTMLTEAMVELAAQVKLAETALVGLRDQLDAAESDLKEAEKAVKPLQKAFDVASGNVKKLKDLLSDLQSELSNIAGGGIDLPGERELKETIFGVKNAINILEQQRRELLRSGASKDDPRVKALDEDIKRHKEELEYLEGKLRAEYDGQRHALDLAAQAGNRVTQTFEEQYARIVAIKAEQAKINAETLPAMIDLEKQSREQLEAAKLAVEGKKELVDQLKEDYERLKEATEKWAQELDRVLEKAKDIKRNLNEALDTKRKLAEGSPPAEGSAAAARAGGPTVGSQTNVITINAGAANADQLARSLPPTLATLARTRVTAGAL